MSANTVKHGKHGSPVYLTSHYSKQRLLADYVTVKQTMNQSLCQGVLGLDWEEGGGGGEIGVDLTVASFPRRCKRKTGSLNAMSWHICESQTPKCTHLSPKTKAKHSWGKVRL